MSETSMLLLKKPSGGIKPLTKAVTIDSPVWPYMAIDMVAAAYKGDIYTYGGSANNVPQRVLGKYNVLANTWEIVNTNGPDIGLNATRNMNLVGDRFYFHRVAAKRIDYYDILTDTWGFYSISTSDVLSRTGFVEFGGELYLVGPSGNFMQVRKFSITNASTAGWVAHIASTGINWSMPNITKWENGVIVLGGANNGGLATAIQKIDFVNKTVEQLGSLASDAPRYISCATSYADRCYLFGGLSALNQQLISASNNVLEFDPATNTIIPVKLRLPDRRINCAIATTDQGVFLLGGRNEQNVAQNNIIKLT